MFVIGVIPTRGPTPPPCSIETSVPSASCAYALTVASTNGCWPGREVLASHVAWRAPPARGALLAQRLVAAGEIVLDMPPTL